MVHYRAVILVIASNDTSYYQKARSVWKAYMNRFPSIKVYMLYGAISLPDRDESDLVYDDISETLVPGILQKTLRAMKYVHDSCTYDYLIRTNISTLWDLRYIEPLLASCPVSRCYAGGHNLYPMTIYSDTSIILTPDPIYSGVSIILTPDLIKECISHQDKFIMNLPDDIAIGFFINNIPYTSITTTSHQYIEEWCSPNDTEMIYNKMVEGLNRKVSYFRVKNKNNRDIIDSLIYKTLLKRIYDI